MKSLSVIWTRILAECLWATNGGKATNGTARLEVFGNVTFRETAEHEAAEVVARRGVEIDLAFMEFELLNHFRLLGCGFFCLYRLY